MTANADTKRAERKAHWKQNPDEVKADILRVATEEFSAHGLSGARIDEIARRTKASKRMIYYYFDDKEGLYNTALETAYARIRTDEDKLNLEVLEPVAALRRLVEFTFDSHRENPQFIRLVMIENIHHADFLKRSQTIQPLNSAVIQKLRDLCDRGKAEGVFKESADPLQLHWMISGLSFFNVSNRATFSCSFGPEMFSDESQKQLRERVVEMVLLATVK